MIARNELGTSMTKQLDNLLAKMPESAANYNNPYEMAIWADDMKMRDNMRLLDEWHFYDQPIYDGINPKDVKLLLDPNFNVLHVVNEGLRTLKHRGPYSGHFDGLFEKSFMLRFFIHMVGDFHQPLHMATRCTKALPTCDAGGNKFPLQGSTAELHALWDHAMEYLRPEGGRVIFHCVFNVYSHSTRRLYKNMRRLPLKSALNTIEIN